MTRRAVFTLVAIFAATSALAAELERGTVEAWESYVSFTEARIASELESTDAFLVVDSLTTAERSECQRLAGAGDVCILKRETLDDEGKSIVVPAGMVHHWYGSVLVPGVSVGQVLELVQSYDDSAARYPEVEDSRLLGHEGEVFEIYLRLRRKKVITLHYNTEHEVSYRTHSDDRASSKSLATRIREISNPGKDNESEKPFGEDRGFLWGLNSYWRFEQTAEGVFVECESISLSRSIPTAAKWLVKSYIDSVPKESLRATLLPIRESLAR